MECDSQVRSMNFTKEEIEEARKNNKLLAFDLEFSRACNLKCVYCYAGAKALPNELTLDEIKDVIDQAVKLGAKNVVNIGGGEPTMYKHYWEILDYERKKGLKSIM